MDSENPLRIADNLALPEDTMTQRIAIIAKTGAGKTYAAMVLVEEMLKMGGHVVVLDMLGVWFGLRASPDGDGPGLPILIVGGSRGDVPLGPGDGKALAEFINDSRQSAIIDLSLFENDEIPRFVAAFGQTLYRLKGLDRTPLHIVIDEADHFAPQVQAPGDGPMLRVIDKIVRRGRAFGFGVTLITQRPAALAKNVLSQIEMLILLRLVAPQDRKAVQAWVESNGTPEQRDVLMDSLAKLQRGSAWVVSPGWLGLFKAIQVRQRETFDSSATPTVGVEVREPQRLADVNLSDLRERFGAAIERARTEDPKALRARINELETEIAAGSGRTKTVVERIEVPALAPELVQRLGELTADLSLVGAQVMEVGGKIVDALASAGPGGFELSEAVKQQLEEILDPRPAQGYMTPVSQGVERFSVKAGPQLSATPGLSAPIKVTRKEGKYTPGEQRMLEALAAHYPLKLTRVQLRTLARMAESGTFSTYYKNLERLGLLVEENGLISASSEFLARSNYVRPKAKTTDELVAMWIAVLASGEARILRELVSAWPHWQDRKELADRVGLTSTSGTFGSYLGTLSRNGLIERQGSIVRASASLFPGKEV